jgi:hypothetical protein
MRNRHTAITIVALALVLASAPVGAIAQEDNNTTTVEDDPTKYKGSIDNETLHVIDYRYEDGAMVVTLESEIPQEITIYAASTPSGTGVTSIPDKTVGLPVGVTTVRMPVESNKGEATLSISNGRGAAFLTVETAAVVFTTAATWGDVQAVAVIIPIGGLWLAFVVGNYIRANRAPSAERVN